VKVARVEVVGLLKMEEEEKVSSMDSYFPRPRRYQPALLATRFRRWWRRRRQRRWFIRWEWRWVIFEWGRRIVGEWRRRWWWRISRIDGVKRTTIKGRVGTRRGCGVGGREHWRRRHAEKGECVRIPPLLPKIPFGCSDDAHAHSHNTTNKTKKHRNP
jgi:hypothetical protein